MSNKPFPISRNVILKRPVFQLSAGGRAVTLSASVLADHSDPKNLLGQASKAALPPPGTMVWLPVAKMKAGKRQPARNVLIVNKRGKLYEGDMPVLWCAIGESEGEQFGQDDSALADYIHEFRIRGVGMSWADCPRNPQQYAKRNGLHVLPHAGFTASSGTFVYVYWGDDEGNLVQPLTKAEQNGLQDRLIRLDVERGRLFIVQPTSIGKAHGDQIHHVCVTDEDDLADVYGSDEYETIDTVMSMRAAKRLAAKYGVDTPEVI